MEPLKLVVQQLEHTLKTPLQRGRLDLPESVSS